MHRLTLIASPAGIVLSCGQWLAHVVEIGDEAASERHGPCPIHRIEHASDLPVLKRTKMPPPNLDSILDVDTSWLPHLVAMQLDHTVLDRPPATLLAGPGSVAWKINREVVLLLGWAPAILMQVAHPLVAAGVAEHSHFRARRGSQLRRLNSTLDAMLALTFGTPEEVACAAAGINTIHDRVHGELAVDAGTHAAGTRYSAHDPALLRWVHATLMLTFPRAYELYVGPLTSAEKDQYCAEATGMAPLLGIPEGYLPTSAAELDAYVRHMLGSGELHVTDQAREIADAILHPPAPFPLDVPLELARLPAIGLLPPSLRRAYGLSWGPRHSRALQLSAQIVRRLGPLTPTLLRHWPVARAAMRRAHGASTAD